VIAFGYPIFKKKFMTEQINIHFYGELNDFLSPEQREVDIRYVLKKPRSVKDLIESIAVPHTEIDLIFVNGVSVDFNYQVQPDDRISVYPLVGLHDLRHEKFELFDNQQLKHLQPQLLDEPHFILDVHLGRLAAYLRMLGFDTLYRNDYDDPELADISAEQQRILLTCDRLLLMRKQVIHDYFVRSREPRQQLLEILSRFDL